MDNPKLLYSKKESAQTLSLSQRTIDALIARRELKVKRVGKRVLITGKSLQKFVGDSTPNPPTGKEET